MNPNGKGTVISLKRPWQVNLGPSSPKGLFGQTGWDCGYTHRHSSFRTETHLHVPALRALSNFSTKDVWLY